MRALVRSKNLDVRSNCGFNPINGADRSAIQVPIHNVYYPPESALKSLGEEILGSGYAGRPLRKDLFMTPQKNVNLLGKLLNQAPLQQQHGRNAPDRLAYA